MNNQLIDECFLELKELKRSIKAYSKSSKEDINNHSRLSHVNLEQYLKLRSIDITELQEKLIKLGFSSLGRSQQHILDTINQSLIILSKLKNEDYTEIDNPLDYDLSYKIIFERLKLFGFKEESRYSKTKIMVTLPSESSIDSDFIEGLCLNGADILRINSAHDDSDAWIRMAKSIQEINKKHNLNIKIYFDLAGPKIRTTNLKKVKPPVKIGSKGIKKRIRLLDKRTSLTQEEQGNQSASIAVSKSLIKNCQKGDTIKFKDILGRKRNLEIIEIEKNSVLCTLEQNALLDSSVQLELKEKSKKHSSTVFNIREVTQEIRLYVADRVLIKSDIEAGYLSSEGEYKAVLGCSSNDAILCVSEGDRVFIDDGKLELKVIEKRQTEILCEVTRSKDKGTVIKEEKGINFPDSDINLKAITIDDKVNLFTVLDYVDIIGISFCQSKSDIQDLKDILNSHLKENLGIVAKIETQKSISNLPDILKALIEHHYSGIMIARGDLAIEVGFENLSVLQEEILNLCEAAHIPVIYATQVLENMMKTNLPSRAEITDAAFAQRADCIMLNKGAYAIDTIKILKTILRQMHKLFKKNRQLLTIQPHWAVKE